MNKVDTSFIFLHIPKNGGTTLVDILNWQFSKEAIFNFKVSDYSYVNYDEFYNLPLSEKRRIRLLTGHMHFGLHDQLVGKTNYITFLRHPRERLLSYYYFVKRTPQHENYKTIFEGNWSFKDFVLNSKDLGLSNIQIELISGVKEGTEAEMLEKALNNIEKYFSFVGFLEHYDESIMLLKHLHDFKIPYYKKRNVTANRLTHQNVDEDILQLIDEQNKGDLILYDFCKNKFDEQLLEIPNFRIKLKKMQLFNRVFSSTKLKLIKSLLAKLDLK